MNTKVEIEKTKETFKPLYHAEITDIEALEISQNLINFFELLHKIDRRNRLDD